VGTGSSKQDSGSLTSKWKFSDGDEDRVHGRVWGSLEFDSQCCINSSLHTTHKSLQENDLPVYDDGMVTVSEEELLPTMQLKIPG
jgi:hypothetical protein